MSDMQTFNQLDNQMKSNKDLLYDGTWIDALWEILDSMESHCTQIIEFDPTKVPDDYADIHDQCKTGCQLYLDGIDKYTYGTDLMEGSARVEGRSIMQDAAAVLNTAVSSLQ